jgi:PPK2 family polyphosphate:nucleotide phosphotransferase
VPPTTAATDAGRHRIAPADRFVIAAHDTGSTGPYASEKEADRALAGLRERLADLQDRFSAAAEHALLVVLQGFDGSGKDHVIKHVLRACDPAEVHVFSFNTPVGSEREHDFLWRFHQQMPEKGRIHVFDRSYYEEVISARVHGIVDAEGARSRTDSITDLERILRREGTVIVKLFLHVSKDCQAERVAERLRDPRKQHEFSAADVRDRELWDAYDRAYEDVLNSTSSDDAPWHAIPADHRWYARTAAAEILVARLEQLDPQYPPLDEDEVREAGLDPADLPS